MDERKEKIEVESREEINDLLLLLFFVILITDILKKVMMIADMPYINTASIRDIFTFDNLGLLWDIFIFDILGVLLFYILFDKKRLYFKLNSK